MMNQELQRKQKRKARYDDMELRVSEDAKQSFRRKAYDFGQPGNMDTFVVRRNLSYLQKHAGLLDEREAEVIKRIVARVKGEW